MYIEELESYAVSRRIGATASGYCDFLIKNAKDKVKKMDKEQSKRYILNSFKHSSSEIMDSDKTIYETIKYQFHHQGIFTEDEIFDLEMKCIFKSLFKLATAGRSSFSE